MHIRILLIAVLAGICLPAAAELVTVSRAYELSLSDVSVPATPNSGITFKECADCDRMSVRVTPNTQYIVNGKSLPLKEFRKKVFQVHDRATTSVTVLHHLESDTIVSVTVAL